MQQYCDLNPTIAQQHAYSPRILMIRPAKLGDAEQALKFSLIHEFQGLDVERLIRDDFFQPAILIFKLPQLDQIACFHAAVFRTPIVQRGVADSVLAT